MNIKIIDMKRSDFLRQETILLNLSIKVTRALLEEKFLMVSGAKLGIYNRDGEVLCYLMKEELQELLSFIENEGLSGFDSLRGILIYYIGLISNDK